MIVRMTANAGFAAASCIPKGFTETQNGASRFLRSSFVLRDKDRDTHTHAHIHTISDSLSRFLSGIHKIVENSLSLSFSLFYDCPQDKRERARTDCDIIERSRYEVTVFSRRTGRSKLRRILSFMDREDRISNLRVRLNI